MPARNAVKLAIVLLAGTCFQVAADVSIAPWADAMSVDAAFSRESRCETPDYSGNIVTNGVDEPQLRQRAQAPVLMYFTIAGSPEYESMLRLLLLTLRPLLTCSKERLRILVISAPSNADRVVSILEEVLPRGTDALVHIVETPDVFTSAVNKLSVTDVPNLPLLRQLQAGGGLTPAFDRVVYMDVDMLVLPPAPIPARGECPPSAGTSSNETCAAGAPRQHSIADWPLQQLLQMPLLPNVLYAPGELHYDVDHQYFSLNRYTGEQLQAFRGAPLNNATVAAGVDAAGELRSLASDLPPGAGVLRPRKPFNTGFFMFRPTEGMVNVLRAAHADALSTPIESRPPYCMEQPYLNYHLHTRDAVDWLTLQPFIVTDTKLTPSDGDPLWPGAAVIHITGLSRTSHRLHQRKLARARSIFTRLLAHVPREELLG